MHCPYCDHDLQTITTTDKKGAELTLKECLYCGGHFVDSHSINSLPLKHAKTIDAVLPKGEVHPPEVPRCPVCNSRLSLIKSDSVAKGVYVWACPNGDGNFFSRGELLEFKHAQEAKITYHRLWGIPFSSITTVLLPVFIFITIASTAPSIYRRITNPKLETDTPEASANFSTPTLNPITDTSTLIYFTTTVPATTKLNLYQGGQLLDSITISPTDEFIHTITLNDVTFDGNFTYSISITYQSGLTEVSPLFPLQLL